MLQKSHDPHFSLHVVGIKMFPGPPSVHCVHIGNIARKYTSLGSFVTSVIFLTSGLGHVPVELSIQWPQLAVPCSCYYCSDPKVTEAENESARGTANQLGQLATSRAEAKRGLTEREDRVPFRQKHGEIMANIAVQRIKREFKEVLKSEEVGLFFFNRP